MLKKKENVKMPSCKSGCRSSRSLHQFFYSSVAASLLLCPAVGHADDADNTPTRTPIKHLVVIFEENHTFDNYFGTYPNAANIPGEQSWIGIPASEFHARAGTPKANNYVTNPDVFMHNPNVSNTGAEANPQRWRPADAYICSPGNAGNQEQMAVDEGRMDRFSPASSDEGCPPDGTGLMNYYDGNTLAAWWNYAQHYALSDAFFSTNYSPSTPGHLNLISGDIHGAVLHGADTSGLYTNPVDGSLTVTGNPGPFLDDCTPSSKNSVEMTGTNVGDLLNAKNVTWGWFAGGFAPTQLAVLNPDGSTQTPAICGQSHTANQYTIGDTTYVVPNPTINFTTDIHGAAKPDYGAADEPFQYYASTRNTHHLPPSSAAAIGRSDQANHQYDVSDFLAALKAGNMAAVSFLKPPKYSYGHPGESDPLVEQAWAVQMINKIMTLPEWQSTAIIIAYDDSGAFYDHVAPPVLSPSNTPLDFHCGNGSPAPGDGYARCRLGLREPFLLISPWAKENYIDHTVTEHASILRFIEDNWGLGFIDGPTALPPGTESVDRYAGSLMGMLDFTRAPNVSPLLLDPIRGTVENGQDQNQQGDQNQEGDQNQNGG